MKIIVTAIFIAIIAVTASAFHGLNDIGQYEQPVEARMAQYRAWASGGK